MKKDLLRILAFVMSLVMLFSFAACGTAEEEEVPDISLQLSSSKLADGASTENETYKIQELTLPVYHCLAAMAEEHYFKI